MPLMVMQLQLNAVNGVYPFLLWTEVIYIYFSNFFHIQVSLMK